MRRDPFEPTCPATVRHRRSHVGVVVRDHRALFLGSERGHKLRDIDRYPDGLMSRNTPQEGVASAGAFPHRRPDARLDVTRRVP